MIKTKPIIRSAQEADIQDVSKLYSYVTTLHRQRGHSETLAAIQDDLHKKHIRFFVAESMEGIVGFLKLNLYQHKEDKQCVCRDYGYIPAIAVAPHHHRRGIGSQLLQHGEQWLQRFNVNVIELHVAEFNRQAIACYKNLRYITIERGKHNRRMVKYIPHNQWDKH